MGWGGHHESKEEEGSEGRRVSKPATGRLTIVLGMGLKLCEEGGLLLPHRDWLTDGKKRKSFMTPALMPPSREEPDGTKAPHCCPLTQDHQSPAVRGRGGKGRGWCGRG